MPSPAGDVTRDRHRRAVGDRRALPRFRGARSRRSCRSACSFVEFHVSDRDLDAGAAAYHGGREAVRVRGARARVLPRHADRSLRRSTRRSASCRSQRIQKTIDLARDLAPLFAVGPGAVSRTDPRSSCTSAACRRGPAATTSTPRATGCSPRCGSWTRPAWTCCSRTCRPIPWYFGGRWFGHVLCDAENTVQAVPGVGPRPVLRHLARRARMREERRQPARVRQGGRALRAPPPRLRRRRHLGRGPADRRRRRSTSSRCCRCCSSRSPP